MSAASDTMTLSDFLLARIAEREAVAQAAMSAGAKWVTAADNAASIAGADAGLLILINNPVHMLAECEAKRRIVEAHPRSVSLDYCETCFTGDHGRLDDPEHEPWPCPTLRALALPFADHSDYRSEWRP